MYAYNILNMCAYILMFFQCVLRSVFEGSQKSELSQTHIQFLENVSSSCSSSKILNELAYVKK